jgi:hypothetical protein
MKVTRKPSAETTGSSLPAWVTADLPEPPYPTGFGWVNAVGPGVIVLGVSIGSGEFLLGPAAFVRYGLSLLWVTAIGVTLQTVLNTELMRYTLATGEPVFTGFMRTRPASWLWGLFYAVLYFLQIGWPGWAATSAGAMFFLWTGRLATAADSDVIYAIGVVAFLTCVVVLAVGRRIERTLEILNWVLVVTILGGFLIMAALFVPGGVWRAAVSGLIGFDTGAGRFDFLPAGADYLLLGALVAYSGAGGVVNVVLTNWARDKGYGMGQRSGYIPAAMSGERVALAATGFIFEPSPEAARRWQGWWRIVRVDQWGVFFVGGLLGMVLPALLYVTFVPRGTDIQGLGISAALADSVGARQGALVAGAIAFLGAWVLFKTQLDNLEGMVRAITDILWTASARVRGWRGGDVRAVYYTVLAVAVVWSLIAMKLAQPLVLLLISANVAGFVLVVASLHLLYLNTRLLPVHVRPPMWRRVALVVTALFYSVFVALAVYGLF